MCNSGDTIPLREKIYENEAQRRLPSGDIVIMRLISWIRSRGSETDMIDRGSRPSVDAFWVTQRVCLNPYSA
jgi:hypothetical protein